MGSPYTARGVRMLGESLGGQSQIATPGARRKPQPHPKPHLCVHGCPELVGTLPDDVDGDGLVAFLGLVGKHVAAFLLSPAVDYDVAFFSLPGLNFIDRADFGGALAPDYEGSTTIDEYGTAWEWRRDVPSADHFQLERWDRSGSSYSLTDSNVAEWVPSSSTSDPVLGTAWSPYDKRLYTFNMQDQTGAGTPTGLRVVSRSGEVEDRGDGWNNGGFASFSVPVLLCDGSAWMISEFSSGDGIIRVGGDGALTGVGLDWGTTYAMLPLTRADVLVWWDSASPSGFFKMYEGLFGDSPLNAGACDVSAFEADGWAGVDVRVQVGLDGHAYIWNPDTFNLWRTN